MDIQKGNGGFVVAKKEFGDIFELAYALEHKGFKTLVFQEDNLLLASRKQFSGQGIWRGKKGCIAYDLDLTNQKALEEMVEEPSNDIGLLIWTLYQRQGREFVKNLRGAFAFAIWDQIGKKILVFTDAFGIRPVVYSSQNGNYWAASRIRSLLLDKTLARQIRPEAIYHYLFFQAICSPLTIYKGIRKLEPGKGHLFANKRLEEICHYDIEYNPKESLTEKEWQHSIFQEVQNSVDRFLPLSTPKKTGCFLSGGTDSSTVAGLVTKLSGKPANTFSIGFDDPAYSEIGYANIAVETFGTNQCEYIVTPDDTLNLIHEISNIYDEPFGNASVIAAYYCAKSAKEKGMDVMLGGDGGDEIFGGNERYVTNLVFSRYHQFPKVFRKWALEPLLKLLPDVGVFHKASRYVRRANVPNPYRFYSYNHLAETADSEIWAPDFVGQVSIDNFMDLAKSHYDRVGYAHEIDRLLYLDMKFTITDNDLRKVTQMVEAAGLRVRYPYLDLDLVNFTGTIPPTLKVKYGKNRYIFKKAMENFLPKEIIHKSKHGMGLPIANWFRTDARLSQLVSDQLFFGTPEIHDFVKPSFMNALYKSFKNDLNTSFYGDMLWVYLILELWLKNEKSAYH